MFKPAIAILFSAFVLGGCANVRLIDADVRSFASPPSINVGAHYRFERLPSQQLREMQQSNLEAMAREALSRAGLEHDEANARYSVQVSYGMRVEPYYENPSPFGWGLGWNLGWGSRGGSVGVGGRFPFMGFPGAMAQSAYWHQASLIIRSLGSQQVVYETSATHHGLWADTAAIAPALLEAALKDFPNPPAAVRRINIEIPR